MGAYETTRATKWRASMIYKKKGEWERSKRRMKETRTNERKRETEKGRKEERRKETKKIEMCDRLCTRTMCVGLAPFCCASLLFCASAALCLSASVFVCLFVCSLACLPAFVLYVVLCFVSLLPLLSAPFRLLWTASIEWLDLWRLKSTKGNAPNMHTIQHLSAYLCPSTTLQLTRCPTLLFTVPNSCHRSFTSQFINYKTITIIIE